MPESAGWVDVESEAHDGPMWFGTDPDDAYYFVSTMGSTRFRLSDVGVAARSAALDDLRATLEAHHTPDGVRYDSAVWVIVARRP